MALMKMKDICTKIGSGATPRGGKKSYTDSGISLIRSQNVLDFSFSCNGLAYINEGQAKKLNNVIVEQDDVLLNITGDSVARACLVEESILPARVNQHVAIVRANPEIVISSYLLYFLQMKKPYLLQMAAGGATRNALTKKMIEELEIDIPILEKQKKIVSIIDDLQKKIKKNNEINENLQQQAQALYKEHFIDMQPFDGAIPEGWHRGTISEIIELHDSKRIPLSSRERANLAKIYPYYGATSVMDYVDRYLFDGIYLLLGEDGTVTDNKGFPILQYVEGKFWVNNHAHIITGKNGFTVEILYLLFSLTNVQSIVTGAVQPKISQANLNKVPVIIPSEAELSTFDSIIQPIFSQIRNLRAENNRLAVIRDTMLPRLISGELDVSDVQL
ncbi:MAG TPA: restriction endonuclease subunit S [Candidatus Anaerobutyricum avicola]|nr:restriction endonuclease subunit S [Candidatus Anaerobutyricum avicola]